LGRKTLKLVDGHRPDLKKRTREKVLDPLLGRKPASAALLLEPVVFCIDPSVRNLNRGPRALVIAVRKGDITSSACFIVGAVVI
jgi:hypothetical protein